MIYTKSVTYALLTQLYKIFLNFLIFSWFIVDDTDGKWLSIEFSAVFNFETLSPKTNYWIARKI